MNKLVKLKYFENILYLNLYSNCNYFPVPRVQAVVYCARSLNEAENESVVTQGVEYANQVNVRKTPFRLAPPVIPLTDEEIEKEHPLVGKYLKFMPSACMSGCFVATVTREVSSWNT